MCLGTSPTCTFSTIAVTTDGATQLTLKGLSKGTNYQFSVLAYNSIGYSAASPSVTVVAANVPNSPNAPVNNPSLTS